MFDVKSSGGNNVGPRTVGVIIVRARAHTRVLLLLRDKKITFEAVVSIRLNNNNTTTKNQCVRHAAAGDRKREC